jgi:hypothetical protein
MFLFSRCLLIVCQPNNLQIMAEDIDTALDKLLTFKEAFTCPITQELMVEPVVLVSSGHSFEKQV